MSAGSVFSLEGKKIFVTGAAGHLGKALCRHLLGDGAIVFAADFDRHALDALEAELAVSGGAFFPFSADLSREDERVKLRNQIGGETKQLDGAVFAAAFVGTSDLEGWAVPFADQSISTWRRALELNLTAPFHLAQLFASLLLKGQQPSIVNVGSIYGSLGPDWQLYDGLDMSNPAAYGVAKGGLIQLTRWLSSTLAPNVRVNIVSPGGLLRSQPEEFVRRYENKTPLARMATEQDVVNAISYLLSEGASYVTGQNLVVDGGYSSS